MFNQGGAIFFFFFVQLLGISNSFCAMFIKILAKEFALASFLLSPYSQVFKEAIAFLDALGFFFLFLLPVWLLGVIYACKRNKLHFVYLIESVMLLECSTWWEYT